MTATQNPTPSIHRPLHEVCEDELLLLLIRAGAVQAFAARDELSIRGWTTRQVDAAAYGAPFSDELEAGWASVQAAWAAETERTNRQLELDAAELEAAEEAEERAYYRAELQADLREAYELERWDADNGR